MSMTWTKIAVRNWSWKQWKAHIIDHLHLDGILLSPIVTQLFIWVLFLVKKIGDEKIKEKELEEIERER